MSLFETLSKISEQIQEQRHLITSEDDTILVSIQPFVRALGYDTQNLTEFKSQYIADAKTKGSEKVDYAILREGRPIIFVEAKAANIPLSDNHWKQLHHYFNAEDVRFGILTNGIEYRFYTDLKKRNIMDKQPFMTIDMLNLNERLLTDLEGFTKSGFDPERIIAGAQKRVMERLLRKEMDKPSDELIKLFARQLQSGRLRAAEIQRYSLLLTEAWRAFVEEEIAKRPQQMRTDVDQKQGKEGLPNAASDIIEVPVFACHKRKRFKATLLVDDVMNWHKKPIFIKYEGVRMSYTDATWEALRAVSPNRKTTKSAWQFWKFRHPVTGEDQPIRVICDDVQKGGKLRQQLLDNVNT